MNRVLAIILISFVTFHAYGQKRSGDYIESTSNNISKCGKERMLQYRPEGQAFVCVNGRNRYTRALYGGFSDFRLETSDRPVFATYKKNCCRNISYSLKLSNATTNKVLALDSTDYCESRYIAGRRDYIVRDSLWKGGELHISVLAMNDMEGAVWHFVTKGFNGKVSILVKTSNIRIPQLNRNGDMGVDPSGCFESSNENVKTVEIPIENDLYIGYDNKTQTIAWNEQTNKNPKNAKIAKTSISTLSYASVFAKAENYRSSIASRITFHTPDDYINTLGGTLCIAADGDWDGDTWQHGCIGWRMPLAGWRAGFLGDVLGWYDRAVNHFNAYSESQLVDVPCIEQHPTQDSTLNLARAVKRWGTPMYSNGYICRYPHRKDVMNHYDMNLNYIDELLWHFCWDADTAYMRKMWPVITSHLKWEKLNFDPDNDGLYDAYCCIWASDALYYNSGAVTHSSAYNYRANYIAARIAEILGEDAKPYQDEAAKILAAINNRLWMSQKGVWAEFQDFMGLKRLHTSPAVWTIYTAIDCGVANQQQSKQAVHWIDKNIPHIPVQAYGLEDDDYKTISTSNWMPYSWSINNVAPAEVMHTALAYFEAGCKEEGFKLLKSNILDGMYIGDSPGNFGQLSFYDAARGECYRDFGDCIGISSRALIEGLFGIRPDALNGRCVIQPGFPDEWRDVSFDSPYLKYSFHRTDSCDIYTFTPNFRQPLNICLNVSGKILSRTDTHGTVEYKVIPTFDSESHGTGDGPSVFNHQNMVQTGNIFNDIQQSNCRAVNMNKYFNSEVDDIFKNEYTSPSSPYTTLRIPKQGIGEWCHPLQTAIINDSVFRTKIVDGYFDTGIGIKFRTLKSGMNVAYTSLWNNYPDSIVIPLKGKASHAYLLMAGSTNHMQSRIDNGIIVVEYKNGASDTLRLINPDNWCPIEQDYYVDNQAFATSMPRPYRIHLGSGIVSRNLGEALDITGVYGREIPSGAAEMLDMQLDGTRSLKSLTLRTLSNDVVIGLMGITLQQNKQ